MKSHIEYPLVSVVIPVYNSEKTIGACLEKLLDQSYPSSKTEIIAVNNNSTDNTQDIIDKFNVLSILEKKKGPSAARNAGIRRAKGEIIIFTDADCLADREFINQHVLMHFQLKDTNQNFKVIGGGINGQNKNFWSLCDDFLNWHQFSPLMPPREEFTFLPTANLSVPREVLIKENIFFDEKLFPGEDVDLCVTLIRKGYKIYFHPQAQITHINRTTLKGVFKHCSAWLRPEFTLRVKKIRLHKPKPTFLWVLYYILLFTRALLFITINIFQTKRYKVLMCWPFIAAFHVIWHSRLLRIEIQYSKYIKKSSNNVSLIIDE